MPDHAFDRTRGQRRAADGQRTFTGWWGNARKGGSAIDVRGPTGAGPLTLSTNPWPVRVGRPFAPHYPVMSTRSGNGGGRSVHTTRDRPPHLRNHRKVVGTGGIPADTLCHDERSTCKNVVDWGQQRQNLRGPGANRAAHR